VAESSVRNGFHKWLCEERARAAWSSVGLSVGRLRKLVLRILKLKTNLWWLIKDFLVNGK
jgi:hypothetical protein